MNVFLRNKVEIYQMFHPCHMDFFNDRIVGHMTWGSRDRSWSRMGGCRGLSLIEGTGSLVNVEGFSDLSREGLILLHPQVIWRAILPSKKSMRHGRNVCMFQPCFWEIYSFWHYESTNQYMLLYANSLTMLGAWSCVLFTLIHLPLLNWSLERAFNS